MPSVQPPGLCRIALSVEVIERPYLRKLDADAAHLGMKLVDDVLELISLTVKLRAAPSRGRVEGP